MVANPMQKMKRNSILIGTIIGLVIGLCLCVALYFFLTSTGTSGGMIKGDAVTVYVLGKAVKSGATVTPADVTPKVMSKDNVPADAVSINSDAVAKIDLTAGTILTAGMLNTSGTTLTDDLRQQEYGMVTLPTQLTVGDYIDIRLQMPNGGDYIVISKKQVLKCDSSHITLNMYEEEINLMSNAVIEYYIMPGSKLYATIYDEPGIQVAAVGTYVPNSSVANLISNNPNIKNYITSERYSEALKNIRNKDINSALAPYYVDPDNDGKTEAIDNIEKNIQEEIQSLKESREAYFGTLNSASR